MGVPYLSLHKIASDLRRLEADPSLPGTECLPTPGQSGSLLPKTGVSIRTGSETIFAQLQGVRSRNEPPKTLGLSPIALSRRVILRPQGLVQMSRAPREFDFDPIHQSRTNVDTRSIRWSPRRAGDGNSRANEGQR